MTHPTFSRGTAVLALLAATACGPKHADTTADPSADPSPSSAPAPQKHSADTIAPDELEKGHWLSAYDMVEALRPRWLSQRGPDTIMGDNVGVQVYVDDMHLGDVSMLRGIRVGDIATARF